MDIKTAEALMNYPTVNMSIDKEDLDSSFGNLLREYKRFKKIQLSGAETSGKCDRFSISQLSFKLLLQILNTKFSFPFHIQDQYKTRSYS